MPRCENGNQLLGILCLPVRVSLIFMGENMNLTKFSLSEQKRIFILTRASLHLT
jgi:hypothetical protein